MSESVLVMETPENCYVCPFGTACGSRRIVENSIYEKISRSEVDGEISN